MYVKLLYTQFSENLVIAFEVVVDFLPYGLSELSVRCEIGSAQEFNKTLVLELDLVYVI